MDCADYALLAEAAYDTKRVRAPLEAAGWVRDWQKVDRRSGFACALYRHEAGGERVLAFRGTRPDTWGALVADIAIGLRRLTPQFTLALAAYGEAAIEVGGEEAIVGVCGHSLGGALAQYVGVHYDKLVYAFNAPGIGGIDGITAETAAGDIRNINASGDVVGRYGKRLGRTVALPVPSLRPLPVRAQGPAAVAGGWLVLTAYLVAQHSITGLRKHLQRLPAHLRPFAGGVEVAPQEAGG
ncbi:MAG: DUF2974 domain-containing protein [Rhodospirillaceae bacterium]|nr:DUF2974 domain-containing protein [Rhodospirillaceae bacterium]